MEILLEAFNHRRTSLSEDCYNATHKRTLDLICSNDATKISQLQLEMESLPRYLQGELLMDLEHLFENHFIMHLSWKHPNNWVLKYFSLVLHRALQFSMGSLSTSNEPLINDIVDKVPEFIKEEMYGSVLMFFPDPVAVTSNPSFPTKWIDRYYELVQSMYSCMDKCSNWCRGIYSLRIE